MMRKLAYTAGLGLAGISLLCAAAVANGQAPARSVAAGSGRTQDAGRASGTENAALLKSAEAFIRNLFAWGPEFELQLGPLGPSASPDFYSLPLDVTYKGQSEKGTFYISKDGKVLLRGDMFRTSEDPFAETRAKLAVLARESDPSAGPASASITLVEFFDYECPHCLELYKTLKTVQTEFPRVRIVYKDFPLSQIHPWAETAALGARCAFEQSPAAWGKVHDAIFDNQDLISPENVWEKLVGFATQAGLDAQRFQTCMASADAKQAVDRDQDEGKVLGINSTPTIFVNGRTLIGGDQTSLEQYIRFELARYGK